METISGVISNGQVLPNKPIKNNDPKYCLITILDENLSELRQMSKAMLDDARQERLSALLKENKLNAILSVVAAIA
jgi:dsDNA-binding SOS-regulon protein